MRFGIIGTRSWIAKALTRYLTTKFPECEVWSLPKSGLQENMDLSFLDAVFLFAGRARPTSEERLKELMLVSHLPTLTKPPKRLVYISSMAVEREPTPYAQTKMACEAITLSIPWGRVLRAPVVYGPGQDRNVDMLVPEIAKSIAAQLPLTLHEPFRPFYIMHVDDVCHAAWMLATSDLYREKRILRLTSDEVTPIGIVSETAPGIKIDIPRGWSKSEEIWRPMKPGEDKVSWSVSIKSIKETIDHHIQQWMGKQEDR